MAIISNAPGRQIILADGKLIRRVTQIATEGEPMQPPSGDGVLTSVQITDDAAGLRRGVWEYVQSDSSTGSEAGEGRAYPLVELMGGSREVAVQTHPKFSEISTDDVEKITAAAEQKNPTLLPEDMEGNKEELYELLRRQIKYYLVPSVVGRVTEIESNIPSLNDLLSLGGDSALPSEPPASVWILTGISARGVGDKYEVTREYTLTGDGAAVAEFLYGD
jgi:hypothetical protein